PTLPVIVQEPAEPEPEPPIAVILPARTATRKPSKLSQVESIPPEIVVTDPTPEAPIPVAEAPVDAPVPPPPVIKRRKRDVIRNAVVAEPLLRPMLGKDAAGAAMAVLKQKAQKDAPS
ncbi:hypothetical protein LTR16_006796, partial [Cryomyces antarcticus]